jgi:NADPH:quinone reductase-like Zn-dependent oxidoreductase
MSNSSSTNSTTPVLRSNTEGMTVVFVDDGIYGYVECRKRVGVIVGA